MIMENKKAVKWLSASHFVLDAYSGFLNPILPFIAAKLGISMAIAAVMVSVSNLTSSISQPLFGFIADKWKKRFFIFWGMLFASIFLSLVGVANNVWTLALCIVFGSMGVSFFHPQATSFVSFFSSTKLSSKDMSAFIAMGTVGFALGPLISSSIADVFSLEALPFASLIGIITALSMFLFVPKVSMYALKKTEGSLFQAFSEMFENKTMRILLLTSILKSLVVSSFCLILPFYWKSIGFSVSKIGTILFFFMMFGALGTYTSSIIEKKYGFKKVFYLSMVLVLPLTVIFYLIQGSNLLLSLLPFLFIGYVSFLSVPLNMVMAQKAMPKYKSMISGFVGGFSWGVIGLLLPLVSILAEKIGILNILLIISAVPLLFSYCIKYLPEEY